MENDQKEIQDNGNNEQPEEVPPKQTKVKFDLFKIGSVLDTFTVISKIGEGGYGQIYKAMDSKTDKEVALKIELITPKVDNIENVVLRRFQGNRHCPTYYGSGVTPMFIYLAMQLLGNSLSNIRKSCPMKPSRLSLNAVYRTICQCLKGIEGLHDIGFLHRDVKPSNFAVGRELADNGVVYLLDFGLCRQYVNIDGTLKPSRNQVGFRGTVRYASINAHARTDLSRRDDLWSLFYSFYELITGTIPWQNTNDKDAVYQLKLRFAPNCLCGMPLEMNEFLEKISRLNFLERPNYATMYECLEKCVTSLNCSFADPYDWQLLDCRTLQHWTSPTPPTTTPALTPC